MLKSISVIISPIRVTGEAWDFFLNLTGYYLNCNERDTAILFPKMCAMTMKDSVRDY